MSKTMKSAKSGNQSGGNQRNSRSLATPQNKGKKMAQNNAPNTKRRGGALSQRSVASAYASGQTGKAPSITMGRDSCRIVHRELVQNISGLANPNFNLLSSLPLNPGMSSLFAWLSTQAQNWETYKFNKLRFCYYTRTGSATAGSVVLAPDYDAADPAPGTEAIASSFEDVAEDAPWKDIVCMLRPSSLHNSGPRKYVRTAALAANLDIKTYDSGNLFVFSVDSAGAASWGKLWVEYDVDLFTPQAISSSPVGLVGGGVSGLTALSAANPLGTTPVIAANSAGFTVDGASNVTFTRTGLYLLAFHATGTVLTANNSIVDANGTEVGTEDVFLASGLEAIGYDLIQVNALPCVYGLRLAATTVTLGHLDVTSMPLGSSVA